MKQVVLSSLLGASFLLGAPVFAGESLPEPAKRVIDYHKDIAPIFEDRCIKCHGEKKQKSDYRLDTRKDAISSGSAGEAITVGNSAESLLVKLIAGLDDDYDIMPPKGDPLTAEQVAVIRAWIDQGAVWEGSAAGTGGEAMAVKNDKTPFEGLGDGWLIEATTQKGPLATWSVVDEKSPAGDACVALTTVNDSNAGTFNLLWNPAAKFKNGEISVALKSVSGEEDQGGGVIWRAMDKDNYYIARYNPLEKNLRLYQVKEGKREKLGNATVEKDGTDWATLTISQTDNAITVSLDGKSLIEVEATTFAEAGGVGLWTKADAATVFSHPKVTLN